MFGMLGGTPLFVKKKNENEKRKESKNMCFNSKRELNPCYAYRVKLHPDRPLTNDSTWSGGLDSSDLYIQYIFGG